MQGAFLHIGSNSGFSVLLKDTSTHGQEEPNRQPRDEWTPLSISWATAAPRDV